MSHLSEDQLDQLVSEERARDYPPLNDWGTIAARAREEGLILREQSEWSSVRPWMQAAAAVLLLVGGIAIGRTTTALPTNGEIPAAITSTQSGVGAPASTTRASGPSTTAASFASVDDASAALERSLAEYQRATAFLASNTATGANTADSSRIYTRRLEALEQVGNAMETALQTAPHDPVINQYYLATMGARVATRQMVARPIGVAMTGF